MKLFMESNNKIKFTLIVGTVILTVLTIFSFFVGRYPLTLSGIISGDSRQWQVFVTLRKPRNRRLYRRLRSRRSRFCLPDCIPESIGITGYHRRIFRCQRRCRVRHPVSVRLYGSDCVCICRCSRFCCSSAYARIPHCRAGWQRNRVGRNRGTQLSPDHSHLPEAARRPGKTACIHRILDYGKFKWHQSLYHQRKCDSLYPLYQRTFFVVPADYDAFPAR